ncbi:sensor histidine kinase [Roseixanthobacter glucoisosaccharinicivorans]|uniref:sensor histidine kinase n=1 Tax=Roseixanthobacter glucoisosaccharinicivorans TaxID=3119923 RepID=UPI003728CD23
MTQCRQSAFAWWSRLPLRLRLTLSFLLVSVPPVLIASFIAAQVISAAFESNVEQWIGEIAHFLANETAEGKEEAQHATAIVAAALSRQSNGTETGGADPIGPFADLLASVGYDFVRLYTGDGKVLFSAGDIELLQPLPREPIASIFFVTEHEQPAMMVGAVQALRIGGVDAFLFVANVLDEQFFNAPQSIRSLDLHLIEVSEDGQLRDLARSGGPPFEVPPDVLAVLRSGADSALLPHRVNNGSAVAFAALRDDRQRLVGIIACRLNGVSAALERLGTLWLFIALAGIAGLLSLLVGMAMSRRLSDPLRALTRGVRAVAEGDYHTRVREEGGREIEELAIGFNAMTAQLETLRNLEAEMRHRAQLATLGEAAAVIAHEIRNPLGIIKTSTELVRRKTQMAPGEDRLMMFVLDEVNRIERLVRELLDYARPTQCQHVPVELVSDVVRPVLGFAAPELERRQVTLAVRLPDIPVPVMGDADRLHQALLNLLLNAVEAAPQGGHIIARVALESDGVRIEIEDNGPGVAPEMRDRVFEPFVTSKVNGTGLGLAKVQATVQAHAGTVEYRDAPSGGTIFTIHLPLHAQ